MGKRDKQSAQKHARRDRRRERDLEIHAEHRAAEAKRQSALRALEQAQTKTDDAAPFGYDPRLATKDNGRRARDKSYRGAHDAVHRVIQEQEKVQRESEEVMESLPGGTINERLDSA